MTTIIKESTKALQYPLRKTILTWCLMLLLFTMTESLVLLQGLANSTPALRNALVPKCKVRKLKLELVHGFPRSVRWRRVLPMNQECCQWTQSSCLLARVWVSRIANGWWTNACGAGGRWGLAELCPSWYGSRRETWKMGCSLEVAGKFNSYAKLPIRLKIVKGHLANNFWWRLLEREAWRLGWRQSKTLSLTWNASSLWCLS